MKRMMMMRKMTMLRFILVGGGCVGVWSRGKGGAVRCGVSSRAGGFVSFAIERCMNRGMRTYWLFLGFVARSLSVVVVRLLSCVCVFRCNECKRGRSECD